MGETIAAKLSIYMYTLYLNLVAFMLLVQSGISSELIQSVVVDSTISEMA